MSFSAKLESKKWDMCRCINLIKISKIKTHQFDMIILLLLFYQKHDAALKWPETSLRFISVYSPKQGQLSVVSAEQDGWAGSPRAGSKAGGVLPSWPPDISPQVQLFLLLQGNPSPSAALVLCGCHPVSSSPKPDAVHVCHPSEFPQWTSHQMPGPDSHLPAFPACWLTLRVREPSRRD